MMLRAMLVKVSYKYRNYSRAPEAHPQRAALKNVWDGLGYQLYVWPMLIVVYQETVSTLL